MEELVSGFTSISGVDPNYQRIRWDEVAVEGETGKMFRANYLDRFGRSVLLMKPGSQNTTSQDYEFYVAIRVMLRLLIRLKVDADLVVIVSKDVPQQWIRTLQVDGTT